MRKVFVVLTLAYVVVAVFGAFIAVVEQIPYGVQGGGTRLNLPRDALFGWGTGLSPSVVVLAVTVILAVLASTPSEGGQLATAGVVVMAVAALAGALLTPTVRAALQGRQPDPAITAICIGLVALPALVALVGVVVLRSDDIPRWE